MKIAFFSAHRFEKEFFQKENALHNFEITYFESSLSYQTASLAQGYDCLWICDGQDGQ